MKYLHKKIFLTAIICLLFAIVSCDENSSPNEETYQEKPIIYKAPTSKTITDGNLTITTSTDIDKLEEIVELKEYKPTAVKFQYTVMGNYGYEGDSIPVKSDYDIEAILYFDSTTFAGLMNQYAHADWVSPKYDRNEFAFTWLDEKTKQEFDATDSKYQGHPDFFLINSSNHDCHLWILNRKILLHQISQ